MEEAHHHIRDALELVAGVHRDFAFRFAAFCSVTPEDLLHDFIVRFLEKLPDFDPSRGPLEWFAERQCRTVVNRKHWRRWKRQTMLSFDSPALDRANDGDPAAVVELRDTLARVRDLLGDLTPKQRAAVAVRFGLNGDEPRTGQVLAAALGLSEAAAGERVRRALQQLAGSLGENPDDATAHADGQVERHRRERERTWAMLAALPGPADASVETRRLRTAELCATGLSFRAVAKVIGVSRETVRADMKLAAMR